MGVVPLGIPLLAGPGAITTVIMYMSHPVTDPLDKVAVFLAILATMLATLLILHFAGRIFRRLGRIGTLVITRVMGLLLTALAVQFMINGVIGAAEPNGLLPTYAQSYFYFGLYPRL